MKIGEILIQQNSITQEQLQLALWVQQIWGGRIGRILCSRGYVSESELSAALAVQLGIPAVSLSEHSIPIALCKLFPFEFCLSHLVLPFSQDPDTGVVSIAMSDPRNTSTRKILQMQLKLPFKLYICGYNDLTETLYRLTHPNRSRVDNTLAEAIGNDAIVEETNILVSKPSPANITEVDAGDILQESELAEALFGSTSPLDIATVVPVDSGDFEIVAADDIDDIDISPSGENNNQKIKKDTESEKNVEAIPLPQPNASETNTTLSPQHVPEKTTTSVTTEIEPSQKEHDTTVDAKINRRPGPPPPPKPSHSR